MYVGVEGEAGGMVAERARELDDVCAARELEGCVGVAEGGLPPLWWTPCPRNRGKTR